MPCPRITGLRSISTWRDQRCFSGLLSAGFLQQDVHVARAFLEEVLRTGDTRGDGLGRAPEGRDPDRYQHRHAHCDVLVAGGGPAGLAAALAASARGARVILADEQPAWGGSLLHDPTSEIDGKRAGAWVEETVATLRARDGVTLLSRATVFGMFGHNHVGMLERVAPGAGRDLPRERLWQVRAARIVVAAGATNGCLRATTVPASCSPKARLRESLRGFARPPRSSRDLRRCRLHGGARIARGRCRRDGAGGHAPNAPLSGSGAPTRTRHRSPRGPYDHGHRRARAHFSRAYRAIRERSRRYLAAYRLRCRGHARRLDPRRAPAFAGTRQASLRRSARCVHPGRRRSRAASRRLRVYSLDECLADGWSAALRDRPNQTRRYAASPTAVGFARRALPRSIQPE